MISPAQIRKASLLVARDLAPESMTGEQAVAAVADLAVAEKACATARMFAALRVAQTDAWRGQGHGSAADWLAAQLGISVGAAAAQLATAKRVDKLPKTKEAMRKGKLSTDQAGAVSDAATADPAAEDELLDTAAKDTTANLKKRAARTKAAATDGATRERRIRAERSLRRFIDAEGAFNLHVRGPAIDGVKLTALLRPYEEDVFRTGRSDGVRDTYENRSYDAFYAMLNELGVTAAEPGEAADDSASDVSRTRAGEADPVEPSEPDGSARPVNGATASHPDSDAGHAGDAGSGSESNASAQRGSSAAEGPSPGGSGGRSARRSRSKRRAKPPGGNNSKVIVVIDHSALLRGDTVAGETCEVAGLGPISVEAAKVLMKDAFLAAVIKKGRDVVNVAHLGRGLNAHQRTAVEAVGLRCSNIVCNHTIAIQIDHRIGYVDNPETKLDNQDPLCPECHRKKTHWGWRLEDGTGPRRFLPPDQPISTTARASTPPDPVGVLESDAVQPAFC